NQGSTGNGIGTQLECSFAAIDAHTLCGGDSVIRQTSEVIDEVFFRVCILRNFACLDQGVSEVAMRINDPGDYSLTGQIDSSRTKRRLNLPFRADLREPVVHHNERSIFNWGAAIAGDEPCALKQRRSS